MFFSPPQLLKARTFCLFFPDEMRGRRFYIIVKKLRKPRKGEKKNRRDSKEGRKGDRKQPRRTNIERKREEVVGFYLREERMKEAISSYRGREERSPMAATEGAPSSILEA
jgi:hypothetical protein